MGVDWYACDLCRATFSELRDYYICTSCNSKICKYCGASAVEEYGGHPPGYNKEGYYQGGRPRGCSSCDPRTVTDAALVEFLLCRVPLSKDEAIEKIREQRGV